MMDREQLAADLAKLHGIRVDADDPVLTAALLNQRLLDEAISRLEIAVRASADRITAAAVQQVDGAKEVAASLVTHAGEWSAQRLRTALRRPVASFCFRWNGKPPRAEQASRTAIRIAWAIGAVGAIALAGFMGFLLAGVAHR